MEIVDKKINEFYKKTGKKLTISTICILSQVPYDYVKNYKEYGGKKGREYLKRLQELNLLSFIKK